MKQKTIPQLFEDSVQKYSNNILMWEKKDGNYAGSTYLEIKDEVYKFAAGLISLGLRHGERTALISEGRNSWVISEIGALYTGAINVPLSVKIEEPEELKFRLAHSGTKIAIVSGMHAHKVRNIKNDLPDLEKTIILDDPGDLSDDEITFDSVLKLGEEYLKNNEEEFQNRWQSLKQDDIANICYTSGTTADPKGIMLSHRNYTANVEQSSAMLPVPEHYTSLLILPWDHAFAHTAGIYTLLSNGASMASVQVGKTLMDTLKNIPVNIKETKPTFLLSVPALAKNFRKNIEKGIKSKGPKVEKLFNKALKLAYEYNKEGHNKGKGLQVLKKPLLALYDKILFSKIREGFGGKLEFFIGGGALLDIELQRFFYAIGMPMFQGYGLTEAAPVISANIPMKHKLGSSGYIVKDLEVKICNDDGIEVPVSEKGEIVCRGENVMKGYWKNESATNETLRDGWLFTGDLGYMDNDGFLYVLGRFKSLLISSDGEKFSPEGIEETIVDRSNYVDQMMLYNNQSPYTIALVVPNKEAVLEKLRAENLDLKTEEGQKAAVKIFEDEINKYRSGGEYENVFPARWLPASFAILGEAFTEQNRFLNTTLKMVRNRITEYYMPRIDYMFTPEGKDVFNHQNKNIVAKF